MTITWQFGVGIIVMNVLFYFLGYRAGQVTGAIKTYYMDKAEARKFIWGKDK